MVLNILLLKSTMVFFVSCAFNTRLLFPHNATKLSTSSLYLVFAKKSEGCWKHILPVLLTTWLDSPSVPQTVSCLSTLNRVIAEPLPMPSGVYDNNNRAQISYMHYRNQRAWASQCFQLCPGDSGFPEAGAWWSLPGIVIWACLPSQVSIQKCLQNLHEVEYFVFQKIGKFSWDTKEVLHNLLEQLCKAFMMLKLTRLDLQHCFN